MKVFLCLFMFVATFIAISSCSHNDQVSHSLYKWELTGNERFDASLTKLQDDYSHNLPYSDKHKEFNSLCSIAAEYPNNKRMADIVSYWKCVELSLKMGEKEVAESIRTHMQMSDSIANPYTYNRLLVLLSYFDSDKLSGYTRLSRALKFFKFKGDSVMTGRIYMLLGSIFGNSTEHGTKSSAEFYVMADKAFAKAGAEEYRVRNLLNIAKGVTLDMQKRDSIHRFLCNSPIIQRDTAAYEIVLRNHFLNTDSIQYIDKNIKTLMNVPRFRNELALNLTLKGNYLIKQGKFREGLDYSYSALTMINDSAPVYYYPRIFWDLMMGSRKIGKNDSALFFYEHYDYWKDSLIRQNNAAILVEAGANMKIMEYKDQVILHAQKVRFITILIILSIIMVGAGLYVWQYTKIKFKNLEVIRTKEELAKVYTSLTAESVVSTERASVLKLAEALIDKLHKHGGISPEEVTEIRNKINFHNQSEPEREAFITVKEKMTPLFESRLKVDFPTLSESQIRLATYILAGIPNSRIAQLLNVATASVNTARYRLRKKLGLPPETSLEDFLRSYNQP